MKRKNKCQCLKKHLSWRQAQLVANISPNCRYCPQYMFTFVYIIQCLHHALRLGVIL